MNNKNKTKWKRIVGCVSAIAMLLGFVVIMVLHGYNPLMSVLTSAVTRVYIVIMCAFGGGLSSAACIIEW